MSSKNKKEREKNLRRSLKRFKERLKRPRTPEEQAASDKRWEETHRRIQKMVDDQGVALRQAEIEDLLTGRRYTG